MDTSDETSTLYYKGGTGEWVEIEIPEFKPQTTHYVSEYFERNNKQKPSVSLSYKDVDLETLRPVVVKLLKDDTISNDLAALFLVKFGERFKATLTEKWESFGVTISEPGEVKLSSIIDINFGDKEIPSLPDKVKMGSSKDDNWIASFLTSIYRINRATNENHKSELSKAALNIVNKNCRSGLNTKCDFTNYRYVNMASDDNYCKIIAAYDMFLCKTKIKEYQFLRWGTISSRFRDCSALSTWIEISNACGYTLSDFKQWVFVYGIVRDLKRILKDGEEIDKPDSYLPYLYDLRLSGRPPYTCSVNPAVATFLATLKVYLGEKGASNAKDFICDRHNVCLNGLSVAYVLRKKYCLTNKPTSSPSVSFETDAVLDKISTPDELFAYLDDKQFSHILNGPLGKFKKSIDSTIVNPREGTLGYFLTYFLN